MKITHVKLAGFRGFNREQTIRLGDGRSLCIQAANGRGKSSVVDAMEFWASGDVAWVHRDGVGLGALVHLCTDEATVEIATDRPLSASRTLSGSTAGELRLLGPAEAGYVPGPIPILRYETMAGFVEKSANDKRAELMSLLGLERLLDFRNGIRTVARSAKANCRTATRDSETAEIALTAHLDGAPFESKLAELSAAAALVPPLNTAVELVNWSLGAPPSGSSLTTAVSRAQSLVNAETERRGLTPGDWDSVLLDDQLVKEAGLGALLSAARAVLGNWDRDQCPLCLQVKPQNELVAELLDRSAEVAAAENRLREADEYARRYLQAVSHTDQALTVLAEAGGHEEDLAAAIKAAHDELRAYVLAAEQCLKAQAPLPPTPPPMADDWLTKLQSAAAEAPAEIGPALLDLSRLQGLTLAQTRADDHLKAAEAVSAGLDVATEITEQHVDTAIDQMLDELNGRISSYYAALIDVPAYGDVKLVRSTARAGGVEFRLIWDGQEEVSPPQRIMSASQLNALGLAVFLARLRHESSDWKTFVLDDVVSSFDATNRTRLVRLLEKDFADWQIILLTHDSNLLTTVSQETGWLAQKVARWDPLHGPDFGEAEPRTRLRQLLNAGHSADELGNLARQSVERTLERLVYRLRLPIRHEPTNMYSARDYLDALVTGLINGNFPRANDEALKHLQTDNSVTNRLCHYKPGDPAPTESDLTLLLEDLTALDEVFRCSNCKTPAWKVQVQGSSRCQCSCGQLSCAS
jgi:hypothetical protein